MKITSIEQARLADETSDQSVTQASEDTVITTVTIAEVESSCILSRLLIAALGRPGRESDMQLFTSGDQCVVMWTKPQLSLAAAQAVIQSAISPPA